MDLKFWEGHSFRRYLERKGRKKQPETGLKKVAAYLYYPYVHRTSFWGAQIIVHRCFCVTICEVESVIPWCTLKMSLKVHISSWCIYTLKISTRHTQILHQNFKFFQCCEIWELKSLFGTNVLFWTMVVFQLRLYENNFFKNLNQSKLYQLTCKASYINLTFNAGDN